VRRYLWIVAIAAPIVVLPASPSGAGGWDTLSFPKDHYLVGSVASTTQRFFAGRLNGAGDLDGGPYYAYLLPHDAESSIGLGMIEPPDVPAGAIRLGILEVSGPFDPPHAQGTYGRASLTFRVPDVPTGRYSIGFCDVPCRHGYIGWLAWADITIVHTETEGRMLAALDRRGTQIRRLRDDLRRAGGIQEKLEGKIDTLGVDLRERTMALRLEAANTRAAATEREPEAARPLVAGWEAGLLAVALVLAAVLIRRRRLRVVVPDTVPDGRVERERART
jgi:hypothetical protein